MYAPVATRSCNFLGHLFLVFVLRLFGETLAPGLGPHPIYSIPSIYHPTSGSGWPEWSVTGCSAVAQQLAFE